ncbi:TAT-variant-translocated molybdopterin oxidoreductase [Spongiivirga sp. MCCC 1A20706]|uniref:TAT-variant-translocated molybdopterin oxidoreductase n=1 Tax=Spongiivirga sp. MCCC 1A20706 TaxID=3160963 RepID=UPI003977A472
MASNKKYWKSVEELDTNSTLVEALKQNEFVEEIPTDEFLGDKEVLESSSTSRRDFLKYVGFSTAAASLAACEGPVIKSIPYVVQPDSIVPGVANHYATTIANGFDFASVLVKTREGRPIFVKNHDKAATNASANGRVIASVLDLYDSGRLQGPTVGGEAVSWNDFDNAVAKQLVDIKSTGKELVLLTQTFASPSTAKLINEFKENFGNVRHVTYDAVSESAALDAFQNKYGVRALADYDFSKADVIISVGADILGDWQGGGYDAGYAKGRVPHNDHGKGKMSYHAQFEANMTLSGANADNRVPLTPVQQKRALAKIYAALAGGPSISGDLPESAEKAIKTVVARAKEAGKNKTVVVSGIQDATAQALVLEINEMLGSEAFDTDAPKMVRSSSNKEIESLVAQMHSGQVGGIIMAGINPVYSMPSKLGFEDALSKVGFRMTYAMKADETANACEFVAAAPHYLESWGDAQIKKGHYSLTQPTIRPLFDTRQFQDGLLQLTLSNKNYYDYVKDNWNESILVDSSWNQALHDGVFQTPAIAQEEVVVAAAADEIEGDTTTASAYNMASELARSAKDVSGTQIVLYTKTGMGDGQQANNPWLQEFPDPITRASWDNYVTMNASDAAALGIKNENVANGALNGHYATVNVEGAEALTLPVIIQPGQAKGTIGVALGYGRKAGVKDELQTGQNAYSIYDGFDNVQTATVSAPGNGWHEFACVQLQNTLMGRGDIIRETTLDTFATVDAHDHKNGWNVIPMVSKDHQEIPVTSPDADLWDSFDRSVGHHFNLSIDLNACTGCGACVVACHAENNVPVVGKSEMRRSRNMHWLRIDRYYSSEETFEGDNQKKDNLDGLWGDNGSLSGFGEMENPADNPQVAFQPVMCQHCNHAPCETVCPVAATAHGRQGQNHMAYNRCVGTRYCANNCPYKVRRFNWFLYNENDEFDYHMNDDLGRMVLNPDVVVRSRGVMEKCSMCIQMTQKSILDAKREGRTVKDSEFQTACSAACSSNALVFGDINNKESEVAKLKESDRMYHLLEHVGTEPNVFYHVKVRNTDKEA